MHIDFPALLELPLYLAGAFAILTLVCILGIFQSRTFTFGSSDGSRKSSWELLVKDYKERRTNGIVLGGLYGLLRILIQATFWCTALGIILEIVNRVYF